MARKRAALRGSSPAKNRQQKEPKSSSQLPRKVNASKEDTSEPKNKGGRPSDLDDESLLLQRDEIFHVFVERWGDVGLLLERARSTEAVRQVFRTLTAEHPPRHWHEPFLLEAIEDASPRERRQTDSALAQLRMRIYRLTQQVRRAQELVNASRPIRKQASEAHRRAIRDEHSARLGTLRQKRTQLRRLEEERRRLELRVRAQRAAFAQQEVVKFVGNGRYPIHPHNVAQAIAGMPDVGWWQSLQRCQKLPTKNRLSDSQQWQTFDLIARSWKPRMSKERFVESLKASIGRLPVRNCREIAFRAYLADNWRYVRLAVEKTELGPLDAAHLVFSGLLRRIRGATPEERVLADRERLPFEPTDPEECMRIYRLKH